jgi:flagellar FliL protein
MADAPVEAPVEQEETEGASPQKKKGLVLPLLLALVAAGAGGVVGTIVLGPAVAPWLAARAAESGKRSGGGGHGGGHGGEAQSMHQLENLVVNPAGSQGTRYLLISVAVEPEDPGMIEDLGAMDVPLRHEVLSILGAKTVEELADIEKRDALVEELKSGLARVVGDGVISRIYLPQYVIQ